MLGHKQRVKNKIKNILFMMDNRMLKVRIIKVQGDGTNQREVLIQIGSPASGSKVVSLSRQHACDCN